MSVSQVRTGASTTAGVLLLFVLLFYKLGFYLLGIAVITSFQNGQMLLGSVHCLDVGSSQEIHCTSSQGTTLSLKFNSHQMLLWD